MRASFRCLALGLALSMLMALVAVKYVILHHNTCSALNVGSARNATARDKLVRNNCSTLFSASISCYEEYIKAGNLWNNLHEATKQCGEYLEKLLNATRIKNRNDVKGVIYIRNRLRKSECTVVTLGIGYDIKPELEIRRVQPTCTFIGADPIESAGKVYREIGIYDPVAVTAMGGETIASVINPKFQYRYANISSTSMIEFLEKHNISLIDYLLLDNEGPEYEMLPIFQHHGTYSISEPITVCQLSAEFHSLQSNNISKKEFDEIMTTFIRKSDLLPIWFKKATMGHKHGYFVNYRNQDCIDKFLPCHW